MERALFPGDIVVVETIADFRTCIRDINKESLLGFDTESRPKFTKGGSEHPVALVQLATLHTTWLIRTCLLGKLPDALRTLLANPRVLKVGLSVHDDMQRLGLRWGKGARAFVDLARMAPAVGLEEKSLRKLCARVLNLRLSKSAQLSNWECENLSVSQMQYAATDAWVALLLYLSPSFALLRKNNLWPVKEHLLGVNA